MKGVRDNLSLRPIRLMVKEMSVLDAGQEASRTKCLLERLVGQGRPVDGRHNNYFFSEQTVRDLITRPDSATLLPGSLRRFACRAFRSGCREHSTAFSVSHSPDPSSKNRARQAQTPGHLPGRSLPRGAGRELSKHRPKADSTGHKRPERIHIQERVLRTAGGCTSMPPRPHTVARRAWHSGGAARTRPS